MMQTLPSSIRRASQLTGSFADRERAIEDDGSDSEVEAEGFMKEESGDSSEALSTEEEDDDDDDDDEEQEEDEDEPIEDAADANFDPRPKRSQSNYLQTKHGYIWSRKPPDVQETIRPKIEHYEPSPKGPALAARTALEAWSLLLDDAILNIIVTRTNEEIDRNRMASDTKDLSYHKHMDLLELKAYFGLLYYTGLYKINNIVDLWSMHGLPLFRATMSRRRFEYLSMCMRFDDKNTRDMRRQTDKFANIRDVWQRFVNNCKAHYEPSSECTIGEQLLKFRGRCTFKMHIPSRKDRYGLKILTIRDLTTHYMFNAIPCIPSSAENSPSLQARKLCESIYHTGRNVMASNWFTSVSLARDLRDKYQLTMIGTVQKTKPEIPASFKRKSKDNSNSQFCYADHLTLVSYNSKRSKVVLYLSSLHETGEMNEVENKPELVVVYEKAKSSSAGCDKKSADFSVTRRTARWPMRILYYILDQCSVNAFILYSLCMANNLVQRRDFILDLSLSLVKPLLRQRLTLPTLRVSLRNSILEFLSPGEKLDRDDIPGDEIVSNVLDKRRNCQICPSSFNRKTRFFCVRCRSNMCKEHTAKICVKCEKHL